MQKNFAEVFKKYLPADCSVDLECESADSMQMYLAKLINAEGKILSYGFHSDSRTATIGSLGRYLARSLPKQLDLPQEVAQGWAYGIHESGARIESILRAVDLWAWDQWLNQKCAVEPVEFKKVLPFEFTQLWLPGIERAAAYTLPLSFFEAEAGIMHVRWAVACVQTTDGQNLMASMMGLNDVPLWQQLVPELWWQQQLLSMHAISANPSEMQRLKSHQGIDLLQRLADSNQKSTWPALRIDGIKGINLNEAPGDLPGHLWCAKVAR